MSTMKNLFKLKLFLIVLLLCLSSLFLHTLADTESDPNKPNPKPSCRVDIIFDGLNYEYSTIEEISGGPPHETRPFGGFVCFNDNDNAKPEGEPVPHDEEGNDVKDVDDTNLEVADPDLRPFTVTLTVDSNDTEVTGTIIPSFTGDIKLWKDAFKKEETPVRSYSYPSELSEFIGDWGSGYVEGTKGAGQGTIFVEFQPDKGKPCSDTVNIEVAQVDLDGDSDNDGDNTTESDDDEDAHELKSDKPGVQILVFNDYDQDGEEDIFDYEISNDDAKFAKVHLKIPEHADIEKVKIKFEYKASDPPSSSDGGLPKDTYLRIWKKDASESRNKDSVSDGGDYVPTDTEIDASDLDFDSYEVDLYIEAVKVSTFYGDRLIKVTYIAEDEDKGAVFECKDEIVVAPIKYNLHIFQPFDEVIAEDGSFLVPTSATAPLDNGFEVPGFGIYSHLEGLVDEEAFEEPQLSWNIEPKNNNENNDPKISFYKSAAVFEPQLNDTWDYESSRSIIISRLTFGPNTTFVKTGDGFDVKTQLEFSDNFKTENLVMSYSVVPGPKVFQLVNPQNVNISELWNKSDAELNNEFKDGKFEVPLKSKEKADLTVYFLDRYKNPLAEGTASYFFIEGDGRLNPKGNNEYDPEDLASGKADPSGQYDFELEDGGKISLTYHQKFYPSCPWQPDLSKQVAANIQNIITGVKAGSYYSITTTDEEIPVLPPIQLTGFFDSPTIDLDLFKKDSTTFTALVTRGGQPVVDAEVSFSSTNGKLLGDTILNTDNAGSASILLTHKDAIIGDVKVICNAPENSKDLTAGVSMGQLRWISTAPLKLHIDNEVISGDKGGVGTWECIDVVDDTGEELPYNDPEMFARLPKPLPAFVPNDGKLWVPVFGKAKITIEGEPNHIYDVNVTDSLNTQVGTKFLFETSNGNVVTSVDGKSSGTLNGSFLSSDQAQEGFQSLKLAPGQTFQIGANESNDIRYGGHITFGIYTSSFPDVPVKVLSKANHYDLLIMPDGHLRFEVGGSFTETDVPIGLNTWNETTIRYENIGKFHVLFRNSTINDGKAEFIGSFSFDSSNEDLIVGGDFNGFIDSMEFSTTGNAPSLDFDFDSENNGTVRDGNNGLIGTLINANIDNETSFDGESSLSFNFASELMINDHESLSIKDGFRLEFKYYPKAISEEQFYSNANILEKAGEYLLSINEDGQLQFSVFGTQTFSVESQIPLNIDKWNSIALCYRNNKLVLKVNEETEELDNVTNVASDSVSNLTFGSGIVGNIDNLRIFSSKGFSPFTIFGINSDNTIETDENGKAEFYVAWDKAWNSKVVGPETLNITVSGSFWKSIKTWVSRSSFIGACVAAGKAFLKGTDGLGDSSAWYETAAAWFSEVIPFAADLRQITFEVIKASSGCDKVSKANVALSVAGIVADAVTFGVGGKVVKGLKTASLFANKGSKLKVLAKAWGKSAAIGYLTSKSLEGYIKLACLAAAEFKELPDDHWLKTSVEFVDGLGKLAVDTNQNVADAVNAAIDSVDDLFSIQLIKAEFDIDIIDIATKEQE